MNFRRITFRRIKTRLTVLYAALFGLALMLIAGAVYTAISNNAERTIRGELTAGATIYNRIWALRSKELKDGAELLSRDFGFRAAVATGDEATIRSAVDNLRSRLGIDQAFIVGIDGSIRGADGVALDGGSEALWQALDAQDGASGVLMIGGMPHQAISAPIMSPALAGWVVFAARLDRKELTSLGRLSAIPLAAAVLHRGTDGAWRPHGMTLSADALKSTSAFVELGLKAGHASPGELRDEHGSAIALASPLKTLGPGAPAVLLLRYPLAKALAPYRPLLATLLLAGLTGLVLMIAGSWMLAGSITRPITALDDAAHRLERGEDAQVEVAGADELGRLAASFNSMAAGIREREQRIIRQAFQDAETGLENRLSLEHALESLSAADGRVLAVAAFGVDRFQYVRGAIGYRLAGQLIAEVGARLAQLRPGDPIARLSTDVVGMAFEVATEAEALQVLAALMAGIEAEPILLAGERVDVSVTAGLTFDGRDARVIASAIERAAIALDQARAGKQKSAVFDETLYGDPAGNLSLISEMLDAIKDGHMAVHYQPKHDLRANRITAAEALVRWRHPVRGLIPPDVFICMAEETGHIAALTECVLAQAIADQARLASGGHRLSIAVNMSGRLLGDSVFADRAIAMIRGSGADICLEVTETAVIENPELGLALIDRYAEAGVAISIDDYGSGLSSLAYLKQIRADELKIDKAFILSLSESSRDALLVKSTIDLAHSLGLKVTAEGVETPAALALLTGMGCDLAQGYLIARPLPLAELELFLAERDAAAEADRTARADAAERRSRAG